LYRSINPNPKATVVVPILEHDTGKGVTRVIESAICADYVESAFRGLGTALLPEDPARLANVRMFQEFAGKVGPFGVVFSDAEKLPGALTAWTEAARSTNDYLLKYAEEGGDFLLGADFSMAEVMCGPMVMRLSLFESTRGVNAIALLEELGLLRLARWIRAVQSRPSIVQTTGDFSGTASRHGTVPVTVSYQIEDGRLINVSVK